MIGRTRKEQLVLFESRTRSVRKDEETRAHFNAQNEDFSSDDICTIENVYR